MTHCSCPVSRRAVVRVAPASEPPSGSVRPKAPRISPEQRRGSDLPLLGLRAEEVDRHRAERDARLQGDGDGGVHPGAPPGRSRGRGSRRPCRRTPREGQSEQAHAAHLPDSIVRELVPLVEVADLRGHDVVGELLDRAAEFFEFGERRWSRDMGIIPWWERALTVRDGLGRPSRSAIHTLVAVRRARSTPVSMPRPWSIHTRSSVARLPVADLA